MKLPLRLILLFFGVLCFVANYAKEIVMVDTIANSPLLQKAAQDGIFYLKNSYDIDQYLFDAFSFAHAFYKDESLKQLQLSGFSGYHDREFFQVESFYLEYSLWNQIFSPNLEKLGCSLKNLACTTMLNLFKLLLPQVSDAQLHNLTGRLLTGNGLYHLSFNHYYPLRGQLGMAPHKDIGYVSLLFIDQKGLFAKVDGEWIAVDPKPGYCLIIIGQAFETLINDSGRCVAVEHFVEEVNVDRVSFLLVTDNTFDTPMYKNSGGDNFEVVFSNYQQYMEQCFAEAYCQDLPNV